MQNPIDLAWDENTEYSKEHIIQALANLGQRMGIKGDSIAYKSFTFNDILSDVYSANEYIGFIEYFKNDELNETKAKFGVTSKYQLHNSNKDITIDTTTSINNILIFPNDLSFSIPINNIEKYSKNSICINENNELTFMLAGKFMGASDDEPNNTILLYYKFDILTNKLITCYKVFYFDTNNKNEKYYCLLNVNNIKENNKLSNNFTLDIHVFNSSLLNSSYKQLFENLFCFKNYESNGKIPFSILNSYYVNIDNLLSYNSDTSFNYDSNSVISVILNNIDNKIIHPSKQIKLNFDTYANELLSVNETDLSDALEYFSQEYNLNLYEELFMINEDINKLYFNIFKYYNEKFYLEYKSTFIKRILFKIYERSSEFNYDNSYRLYIPLDYKFHYICNSNNDLNIYYSNNIYVSYTSLDNVDLDEFWKLNTNLIYDYSGIDKVKVYNFELTYNSNDDELINTIDIKDIYTMPYINANNNWSINDIDTKIRAIGKDAGNPNIIIIFNKNQNDYEILNAISNKKYIESATYEQRWFELNTALFENINEVTIRCCAYIPKIESLTYEYFKDSIIFSISDLNCLEYDTFKTSYKGSYIYTLWNVVENNGELSFELINDTDNTYALTLGSTINLLNANSDASVANLNDQDLILLKSVLSNVGHEKLTVNKNNWLILKNKQSEEYVDEYNLKTSDYNNDLNAILQYNDNVLLKSNHIIHSQNSKYISNINDLSITNSLYPKYVVSTSEDIVTKEVNKLELINKIKSLQQYESRIYVQGRETTNTEELIEVIQNVGELEETQETIEIKSEKVSSVKTNYNEYVFNSNIPSLDYKELFIRNANLLNRLNIISLDSTGQIYNAYIGTSYDESNKNILHIGSNNTNINIGSDTLINELDRNKFNTHEKLSIDFNEILLNASNKVVTSKPITSEYKLNGITYYSGTSKLIGTFNKFDFGSMNINNLSYSSNLIVKINDIYFISINQLLNNVFNVKSLTNYNINCVKINNETPIIIREDNFNSNNIFVNEYNENNINKYLYMIKLHSSDNVFEINDNVIYAPLNIEIMYYTYSLKDNSNNSQNAINIYVSFK